LFCRLLRGEVVKHRFTKPVIQAVRSSFLDMSILLFLGR
jgi:hypothetical protein